MIKKIFIEHKGTWFFLIGSFVLLILGYAVLLFRSYILFPGNEISAIQNRVIYLEQFNMLFTIVGIVLAAGTLAYQMIESMIESKEQEKREQKAREFDVEKEKVRITSNFIKGFQKLIPISSHLQYIRKQEIKENQSIKKIHNYIMDPDIVLTFEYKDIKMFMDDQKISEKTLKDFVSSTSDDSDRRSKDKEGFIDIIKQSVLIYDYEYKNSPLSHSMRLILDSVSRTKKLYELKDISKEEKSRQMDNHYRMLLKAYLNSCFC